MRSWAVWGWKARPLEEFLAIFKDTFAYPALAIAAGSNIVSANHHDAVGFE